MMSLPHWLGGLAVVAAILIAATVVIAVGKRLMRWIEEQYEELQYQNAMKRHDREQREMIRARNAAIRAYYHD